MLSQGSSLRTITGLGKFQSSKATPGNDIYDSVSVILTSADMGLLVVYAGMNG